MAAGHGQPDGVRKILALLVGLVFVLSGGGTRAVRRMASRGGSAVLEYAAPVVAAGGEVAVEIGNVPAWLARTGWGVWLGFVLGTLAALRGLDRCDRWWLGCGLVLVVAAFLSIRGGAPLFFGVVALVGLVWLVPRVYRQCAACGNPKPRRPWRRRWLSHSCCRGPRAARKFRP